VYALFGVELPKSHTRADWSQRPLASEVLQYAAEDVQYLLPARDVLSEQLDKLGRLAWADEDSAMLLNPALYDIDPQQAIHRLKGAKHLRGRRRVAAAGLAAWREAEAIRANRPRQWIVKTIDLNEFPNVKRWYVTIAKRPAVQKGYDVPKKVQDIPMPA
jgi:ribonuclease D